MPALRRVPNPMHLLGYSIHGAHCLTHFWIVDGAPMPGALGYVTAGGLPDEFTAGTVLLGGHVVDLLEQLFRQRKKDFFYA